MTWFAKKDDGPTPEQIAAEQEAERQAQAVAALRHNIANALEKDPAHRVVTVEGMHWICPYTLKLVPAAFGFADAALEYLFEHRPFTTGKAKPLVEVLRQRWRIHIKQHGDFEPRLRILGLDGRWLNPYAGTWLRLALRQGQPPEEIVEQIACALADCPEANDGRQMKSLTELRELESLVARAQPGANSEAPTIGASKHVSGRQNIVVSPGANADMDRAKSILFKMLAEMPAIPGFGLAVHYEPQDEIGGDFFASLPLSPDRILLAIADVAGHGVQGALVVVAALKGLRFIIKETQDLSEIMCRLNDSVQADLLQGQFITCWMGILDVPNRRLEHLSAGHTALAVANPRQEPLARREHVRVPALGLLPTATFRSMIKTAFIDLQPGDLIMQYTDGLTEASNPMREEFGDLRAIGALVGACELGYGNAVDHIVADARRWATGTFQDDITVMVLQCDPPTGASGPRPVVPT